MNESITWKKVLRGICLGKKNIRKICLIRKKRCYCQEKKINSEWHFKRRQYNSITNSAYDLTVSCFKECGQHEPNKVEMFKKNNKLYIMVKIFH